MKTKILIAFMVLLGSLMLLAGLSVSQDPEAKNVGVLFLALLAGGICWTYLFAQMMGRES